MHVILFKNLNLRKTCISIVLLLSRVAILFRMLGEIFGCLVERCSRVYLVKIAEYSLARLET